MLKNFAFFVLLIASPISAIFASSVDPYFSNNDDGIETWLLGSPIGANSLSISFDVSSEEFLDYTSTNGIETINLDFYWQNANGSIQEFIASESIQVNQTNISTWSYLIENADYTSGSYFVQISMDEEDCGLMVPIPLEEIDDDDEDPVDLPIELPEFNCGDDFSLEPISNHDNLSSAKIGDVFYIGGFPILLTQISGNNGIFSGKGIIPLPFKNKAVQVQFSGVKVNTDMKIYEGEVVALANGAIVTPSTDTLDIGGQICLPDPPDEGSGPNGYDEVTGLDGWGFDSLGINSETGTPYDENGFDVNGINEATGTEYNSYGCNRDGVDEDGHPCDPGAGSNAQSSAFADSLSTSFSDTITAYFSEIQSDIQDSLDALNCDGIRTSMNKIVTDAQFDRKFVFGNNDKYFVKGMHLAFAKKPEPIILGGNTRNKYAKQLEQQHIDLYVCDKKEYALDTFLVVLNALDNSDLSSFILDKIRNWSEYEYGLYSNDPVKFKAWILKQIGNKIKGDSGIDNSYFYTVINKKNSVKSNYFENIEYTDKVTASLKDLPFRNDGFSKEEKEIYRLLLSEGKRQLKRKFQSIPPPALPDSLSLLPIVKSRTVGNKTYKIVITKIVFLPDGARLDAHMEISDPATNKKLVFSGQNIPFGPTGLQGGESARLYLGNPVQIRLNNVSRLILKQGPDTYVEWDCKGFSGMGIDAEIEFCRNYIVPLDDQLKPMPDSVRYRLPIKLQDVTWLEFYLTITNAKPFAVAGYEDVKWKLTGMVVDFSSSETPQFEPMEGYSSPFWDGSTMSPAWKGFYMQELSVTLPQALMGGGDDNASDITIAGFDILIDNRGFTGGVSIEGDILNIDDGNMDGWPFSIDYFELRVLNNHYAGAGLGGKINVPIFKENFDYKATMYPNSVYEFTVLPDSIMTADLFLAKAEIYDNSSISLTYDGEANEFIAIATLNGRMTVKTDTTSLKVKLPSLTFQNFKVSNGKGGNAYFSPGIWGLEGKDSIGISFSGFSASLFGMQPYSPSEDPEKAGLAFNVNVSLVKALKINATGGLGLEGRLEVDGEGRQKWVYERIKLKQLFVDATLKGGTEINGYLEWYDEGDYKNTEIDWGKGFRGGINVKFKKLGIKGLQATAQFGKTHSESGEEYKYFFVDAMADLGSLVSVGPITIKGFGGGVFYHMESDVKNVNLAAGTSNGQAIPAIGHSFSETIYRPNINNGLGLKASALITLKKEEIFNGSVSIVFEFYSKESGNGGLKKIALTGQGQFLAGIDIATPAIYPVDTAGLAQKPDIVAPITAYINLTMNFDEPAFDGTLYAFMDAGPVKGAGTNSKLVNANIHFDKESWYIWIGTPTDPCGIKFTAFGGEVKATSYFEIGTQVHSMPDLPANVQSIAYKVNKNEALRRSGAGFMFGASLTIGVTAGIKNIVEAKLSAEVGFDLMLRKMDGVTCDGQQIGLNGWYAAGQMWAYAKGSLEVFNVNVASAGIATVLQMRGPKPFFAQATVGVKVRLLFVTVKKSLKLQLGNDCSLVSTGSNPALGMDAILFVLPDDREQDVSTMSPLSAAFAIGIGSELEMSNVTGNVANYRIEKKSITLVNGQNESLSFHLDYTKDKTSVKIIPDYELPANDSITLTVTVDIYQNGSLIETESKSTTFFTAGNLETIPSSNVLAAYPVDGMANFYKEEYIMHEGFIKLKQGQSSLLGEYNVPDGYTQKIRFTSATGASFVVDYVYDYFAKTITFPMNPSLFQNEELYKLEIVRYPSGVNQAAVAVPSSLGSFGKAMSSSSSSAPLTSSNASEGSFDSDMVIYTSFFRVSKFNNFMTKMNAISSIGDQHLKNLNNVENFDFAELVGGQHLVSFHANRITWFNEEVEGKMPTLVHFLIDFIGNGNNIGEFSTVNYFGRMLDEAVRVDGPKGSLNITQDVFLAGAFNINNVQQRFVYRLDNVVSMSVTDLSIAAGVTNLSTIVDDGTDIKLSKYIPSPITPETGYPVDMKYTIPGVGVTTSLTFVFK